MYLWFTVCIGLPDILRIIHNDEEVLPVCISSDEEGEVEIGIGVSDDSGYDSVHEDEEDIEDDDDGNQTSLVF